MYLVIFILGTAVGLGIGVLIFRHPFAGTLQIIDDPEGGTYLSAVLDRELSYIRRKKYVNMKIRELHNAYYGDNQ